MPTTQKQPERPRQPKQKKKWRDSAFARRLRAIRVNRAVFLSAVIILLALAVLLVITAVANRARRRSAEQVLKPVTGDELTEPLPSKEPDKPKPNQTEPVQIQPTDDRPAPETVPTLSLPVDGALMQSHSADLQVFSRTMQDYRVHLGVDLSTAADAPVLAAADGVVARVWDDPMMGKCVALSHAADSLTVYKNLAPDLPVDIVPGAQVFRGQRIGTVGDTALMEVAEEPHLHLEMTVGGLQVNPLDYFPETVLASLSSDASYEDVGEGK